MPSSSQLVAPVLFWVSFHNRVLSLDRCHRLNDVTRRIVRALALESPKCKIFPFFMRFLIRRLLLQSALGGPHGADHEEYDAIGLISLSKILSHFSDVLRSAV